MSEAYSNYSITPSGLLRSWVSNQFLNSGLVDQIEYNNIDPIIPVQDIDKTSKFLGKLPYMVYSVTPGIVSDPDIYFIKEELMRISVLCNNSNQLVAINSFLIDILDRRDITASDINEFCATEAVQFQTVNLLKATEVFTADQPAGRFVQSITFRYRFTRPLDSSGRFAF